MALGPHTCSAPAHSSSRLPVRMLTQGASSLACSRPSLLKVITLMRNARRCRGKVRYATAESGCCWAC